MAVVRMPLMSLSATDSIGKAITFSSWKGRAYVRKLVKPHNPKSGLQTGQRAGVSFLSKNYASLSSTIKARWLAVVAKRGLTALNSFVRTNQPRIRRNLGIIQDPTLAAGAVEAAPTAGAAAAGTRQLTVTWVDSAGANDWATLIWRSTSGGFTPDSSTLIAIVAHGVQTYTDIKVVSGTPYFYRIAGTEKGGTLGALAAQFTGTPN
jgi:hypothetical protein